jgi:cell division topological specificity factor MinE
MSDIFTNLYNKVIGFFHKVETEENSKEIACNRLRVVLMQDRTNLTPELLDRMRTELVQICYQNIWKWIRMRLSLIWNKMEIKWHLALVNPCY